MFQEKQRVHLINSGMKGYFRNYGQNPVTKTQTAVFVPDEQQYYTMPEAAKGLVDKEGKPFVICLVVLPSDLVAE